MKGEYELLEEIKRIKRKYCGESAELILKDAEDYEKGLLARLNESKSPEFSQAVQVYLKAKSALSRRSKAEYGTYLHKVVRKAVDIAERKISEIKTEHWSNIIREVYPTAAGRNKARRLLHGLYEFAVQQEWVSYNPIYALDTEYTEQRAASIMNPQQIKALLTELQKPKFVGIAATVGFMLWEGMRLNELRELRWESVVQRELSSAMQQWLSKFPKQYHGFIVPRNWVQRWREIRSVTGLNPWQNDTLRHTYAAYHLRFHNDPDKLSKKFSRLSVREITDRFSAGAEITQHDAAAYWSDSWFQE